MTSRLTLFTKNLRTNLLIQSKIQYVSLKTKFVFMLITLKIKHIRSKMEPKNLCQIITVYKLCVRIP